MKILVTGGAGFIGSNFLLDSVKARPGDDFVNADVLTYAANLQNLESISEESNYEFSRTDIVDAEAVSALFNRVQPDVVFHFAAESHVDRSISGPGAFIQANVVGTFNLLEAARALEKTVHFHHVSTDEVYGSLGAEGLFAEDHPYDPSSPYSASKASSDHLVRAYNRTYGMPMRITNCSNNYGPYQFPEKLIPLMIQNALAGKSLPIYGKGLNVRDWLYVGDHCSAIWAVHEKGKLGETYNIGGNNELSNIDLVHQLCKILAEVTGSPAQQYLDLITYVKDRPGHDMRYAIDATKLKNECGWTPSETVDTGLRKTVEWYVKNQAWSESVTSGAYKTWIEENYGKRDAS